MYQSDYIAKVERIDISTPIDVVEFVRLGLGNIRGEFRVERKTTPRTQRTKTKNMKLETYT